MIRLMLQRAELAPALSVFPQDVVVVGRGGGEGAAPDWVLPFADVSRVQCRFTVGGDAVFVEALSERNATFVNNRKITAITRLQQGDVIRFGACTLRLVATAPASDATRSEPAAPIVAPARAAAPGPQVAPSPVAAAPAIEPEPATPEVEQPVLQDMSPIHEQALRWELHGQPPELLLRGDALRRGRLWLRHGSALAAGGALVRRFVEASARRRRQRWVGAVQAGGLALATVVGGSATASWMYPELVAPEVRGGASAASCEARALERAERLVAAAEQDVEGGRALLGLGYALQVADGGGCRALSRAESALRLRLAGQRARLLGQVEGPVQALVLRPDGQLAAVSDAQGALSLVDLRGEGPPVYPAEAGGPALQMAWSADLRWLATGGGDSEVLLWDVDRERVSRHHAFDLDTPATTLAFSPDGALLATGDRGGALRLWDIGGEGSGRALGVDTQLSGAPSRLVFDAAGMRLFGLAGGRVRVWSMLSTGAGRRLGGSVQLDSDLSVTAMAVDLGGHRVVTGDAAGQVFLWKQAGGQWKPRLLAVHGDEVVQVQIVPERDAVISTAADRSIRLIELSTRGKKGGKPFPVTMTASEEPALRVVVDAAGRRMLTVGASAAPELWDLAGRRGEPLARLSEQRSPVRAMALADTLGMVVTGGEDGSLRAWDLMVDGGSAGAHVIGDHTAAIEAVGLARSGSTLASTGRDGQLRAWKLDEHATPERLMVQTLRWPLQHLALSHDGRWIAGAAGNLVHVWDTRLQDNKAPSIELPGHDEEVAHLTFSSDGEWLVSADRKGVVQVWHVASGGPEPVASRRVDLAAELGALVVSRTWVAAGTMGAGLKGKVHAWALEAGAPAAPVWEHADSVTALTLSEDGSLLASGSHSGSVSVGVGRNGRFERTEMNYNLGERIEVLAMVPGVDGASLGMGGEHGTVAVRGLSVGATDARHFKAHEGPVRGLAFVDGADELLTAGQDGGLQWWHLAGDGAPTATALTGHTGAILELIVDDGAQVAVSMGADQTLRVWPLTTQGLLQLTCRAAGRDLDAAERGQLLVDFTPAALCGPPV